ncbi:MAG: two-component sensor histidine kinase, partial [Beijerinckiaceae bacterium]|nr:two-component sensor histidine kinase [Beijerinckiaceae bacterium]
MSLSFFPAYLERPRAAWRGLTRRIADYMPKGLYARSLLIVIVPMVVLQSAIAYFFMERHWQLVTFRLSTAVVQDIGSVVDLYRADPSPAHVRLIQKVAADRLGL